MRRAFVKVTEEKHCRESGSMKGVHQVCLDKFMFSLPYQFKENGLKGHKVLCPEKLRNALLLGCRFAFL